MWMGTVEDACIMNELAAGAGDNINGAGKSFLTVKATAHT